MILEKEVVFGGRLLNVNVNDSESKPFVDRFLKLAKKFEKEIVQLMDLHEIPPQIVMNFQLGDGDLEGFYHMEGKKVSESIVAIEFFTRAFLEEFKGDKYVTDYELIDTFVHELIHNRYKSEVTTKRKAREFMKKIEKKL